MVQLDRSPLELSHYQLPKKKLTLSSEELRKIADTNINQKYTCIIIWGVPANK